MDHWTNAGEKKEIFGLSMGAVLSRKNFVSDIFLGQAVSGQTAA